MKTLRRFIDEDDMDFDEAAESAVEKRKFIKQSREGEITPQRVGWWRRRRTRGRSFSVILCINHIILITEYDWSIVNVICKTPHKMNCSNPSSENDRKDVCRSACRERRTNPSQANWWRAENPEAMKARKQRWNENNKERLASSCKNNRERLNDYWRGYCGKNKKQINQRLREQRQRKRGQNVTRFGVWDQGSEKLERNLVPSEHAVTHCEISTSILTLKEFYFQLCVILDVFETCVLSHHQRDSNFSFFYNWTLQLRMPYEP